MQKTLKPLLSFCMSGNSVSFLFKINVCRMPYVYLHLLDSYHESVGKYAVLMDHMGLVYPVIYKVLGIPGGFFRGFLKHQQNGAYIPKHAEVPVVLHRNWDHPKSLIKSHACRWLAVTRFRGRVWMSVAVSLLVVGKTPLKKWIYWKTGCQ